MAVCKNYIKVAYTITGPKEALLTRLRCKQWDCAYCAEKNAKTWQYWLIKRLPEISQEWYLITLTAHSKKRTELASFNNLRTNIDKLVKRIKRVWGDDIEYVRVFEKHPTSDAIHVHLIMSGITPYVVNGCSSKLRPMAVGVTTRKGHVGTWSVQTWFKKVCQELGMGYMADVQQIKGEPSRAAHYVTKYLTKGQDALHIPYLRHVQVTDGIGSPEFEKSYQWIPVSYITARTFEEPNTRVIDLDTGEIIDNNFWEQHGHYPFED